MRSDWRFQKIISVSEIATTLPEYLTLKMRATTTQNFTLLDDYHWHIWQAGLLLCRDQLGELQLWKNGQRLCCDASAISDARFYWQLGDALLRDSLQKIINVQAFTCKAQWQLTTELLEILSVDHKPIALIKLYRVKIAGHRSTCFLSIISLQGYKKEYARIVKQLSLLAKQQVEKLNLQRLLLHSGLVVSIPENVSRFNIAPEESAEKVVTQMVIALLESAQQYKQGIMDDIDTEFLHQYRITIRKARSLIKLFKKVFSPARYQQINRLLKPFATNTNQLRDLDVLILDKERYLAMLPERFHGGLITTFTTIAQQRTNSLKQLRKMYKKGDYQSQLDKLLTLLRQAPEQQSKQSRAAIKPLVCRMSLGIYQRICRKGLKINGQTTDESIHQLRIECKKLRYLLELFGEFFANKKIRELTSLLKKLQDNLGYFNDYSVQEIFFVELAEDDLSSEQRAAIHGLIAVIYNKKRFQRNLLSNNMTGFTANSVQQKFKHLFTFVLDSNKCQ